MVNSKKKGNAAEVEVAHMLAEWFPGSTPRRRATGEEAGGLYLGSDIIDEAGVIPFVVQVSKGKNPPLYQKYVEAREAGRKHPLGTRPGIAITKRDRDQWLVTMDAEMFGQLSMLAHELGLLLSLAGIKPPMNGGDDRVRAMRDAVTQAMKASVAPVKDLEVSIDENSHSIGVAYKLDTQQLQRLVDMATKGDGSELNVRKLRNGDEEGRH